MIICPNFRDRQVKKEFDELVNAVGETAAYDIWSLNNGNSIDKAPNGAESKLFSDLLNHFNGDRLKAILAKAKIFSKSFKSWFGDWLKPTLNLKGGDIVFGHPAIGKTYSVELGKHAGEFIDWDVEYNRKRDAWIEEHSGTKKGTPEYKKARNEYLIYPENHPDYVEFLTNEWNRVKEKAKSENKILIASPHTLLKMFTEDFDYIINLEQSDFVNRNINRGGDEINSKLWKEGIDNTISNVLGLPIYMLLEGLYFEDLLNNQSVSTVKDENGEPTMQDVLVERQVYHQKQGATFIPRNFLTDRQFKHIELTLAKLFPEITVLWHQDLPEGEYGRIDTTDLEAITIMLSDNYQADTLPHEYAHRYIEMFRNTPIVQKAIEKYGSEEALVLAIGEQTVMQKGDAYGIFKKLWLHIKALFSKQPYVKRAILIELTNAFLQRKDLLNKSDIIKQVALKGLIYFQKVSNNDIDRVKAILQEISNKILFDEELHQYTDQNGNPLKAVSTFKQELLYSVYDDSDLSENQKQYNDDSRTIGTTIHSVMESLFNGTYKPEAFSKPIYDPNTGKLKLAAMSKKALNQLESIYKILNEKYELVASEAMLADIEHGVAGTTDLVLKNRKTGKLGVFDYKTKCIELDGKKENKDGKRLWGFSYVNKSKSGAKTATNAYDFQLGMYQHMLESLGVKTDERGIIPIVYKFNSKTGIISDAFFSKTMGSFEVDPKDGVYHITKQLAVQYDINSRVFGEESNIFDNEYIQARAEAFQEIISNIIKSLKNKALIDRRQGRRSQARMLEKSVDEIGNVSEIQAMLKYVSSAIDQLSRVYNQIDLRYKKEGLKGKDRVEWDLNSLRDYKELALSYNMIGDISGFVKRFSASLTKEEIESIQNGIAEVLQLQENIKNTYKEVGTRIYMDAMMQYVGNIKNDYAVKFEREYRTNHKDVNNTEMRKYINQKLEEHADEIESETRKWLRDLMRVADNLFECSAVAANIGTVFQSKDPFVQASVKYFDEVMQGVDHEYIKFEREMIALVNEFEKTYGGGNLSNHRNMYDDMVEIIDGQAYLVSNIPNSYIVAKTKFLNELKNDPSLTMEQREKMLNEWYDENAPVQDKEGFLNDFQAAVETIIADLSDKKKKEMIENIRAEKKKDWKYFHYKKYINYQQLDEIREAYDDLLEQYRVINSVKFPNKKYDNLMKLKATNDIKYRLWAKFQEINNRGDKDVPNYKKLSNRLPGIRKTAVERVSENKLKGVGESVINYVKENSMLVEDDSMQGLVFTDMNGNVVRQIPLYYNGRLNLSDQSFDLPTIYARWLRSAMEYQAKSLMVDYLLMTSEILKNRLTKTNKVSILSKLAGREEIAQVKAENTYRLFEAWLDQVMYGNKIKSSGEVGDLSIDKVAEFFMKYYSMRVMGFNYISMINNLTIAELNTFVEAIGSDLIDIKSINKAWVLYGKHVPNMVKDIGRRAPEDFVNQLAEWFGIFEEGDPNLRAKGVSKFFTTDAAFWTTNVGEHIAQTKFLLGALYKLKALDENGNELGDMIEFLSFDEKGLLIVDPKVANFDSKRQAEFSMGVRSTLMSMHGNYSSRYLVALLQYVWGKMILMFRKWIYTSWKRRFSKKYYDNIRGMEVEGYHTTLMRVSKGMVYNRAATAIRIMLGKAIDDNKLAVLRWNELTTQERQNVKKSITELSIILFSYAMASVFRGVADDEDDEFSKNFYMNMSYLLYRVYTDMTFYFNPWSMTQIVQDPFPAMSAIDNIGRLYDRIWNPTDVYTTGKNAGENKLLYSFKEMVPIWRQFDRWKNIQYEYDFLSGKN